MMGSTLVGKKQNARSSIPMKIFLQQLLLLPKIIIIIFFFFFFVVPVLCSPPHTISLSYPALFPESFDWDPLHSHFVLGSLSSAGLVSVSDAGVAENFILDPHYAPHTAILGVAVDPPRSRLLAVLHNFNSSNPPFDALAAYHLRSKQRIFLAHLLGNAAESVNRANDVAIDHNGNAYVTNTLGNFVWRVDPQGKASVFATNPLFLSQPVVVKDGMAANCGLNGIAYARNDALLVAQTNSGTLFKINLHDASVRVVQMSTLLPAVDGIAIRTDGSLVAVSAHTAWLLKSKDAWLSAHVVDELPLDSSSFVTAVAFRDGGRRPYVLHSYLHEMHAGVGDREMFTIQQIEFPTDKDDPIWLIAVIFLFLMVVFMWRFQLNYFFRQYTKKRN